MILATLVPLLSILVLSAADQSHDLILGEIKDGDELLYETTESKHALPFVIRRSDVIYPPAGEEQNSRVTAIVVKDQIGDGKGGYVFVKEGGVGHMFVKLGLETQRSHAYNFTIAIYGEHLVFQN